MEETVRAEADTNILIYVPHYYICPECDFRFPEWKDPELPKCPHDGTVVVKMTWVEYAKELETDMKELLLRLQYYSEKSGRKR